MKETHDLEFKPVTRERWPDLDRLFSGSAGESLGNPSRCWCMEWRRPRAEWLAQAGEGNRQAMQALVKSGEVPGILAYSGARPAGWCSVSPRKGLTFAVEGGRFKDPDNPDVWSIICFYVPEKFRGQGLMKGLLRAAVEYASACGAKVVEAYPVTPERRGDGAAGLIPVFRDAGFVEVDRIWEHQAVMRYYAEQSGRRR
ncbi:MAG: GNAT family N-acetyltransferase [Chloroflexi bacterium]|nr:GNAT family N-acetyltransferase [Chloroflexota bacterium]